MRIRKLPIGSGYLITGDGRVWSSKSNRFLNMYNFRGYLRVGITVAKGIQKNFFVHRLVAIAFIPTNDQNLQVNHIDGNKQNNRISNLEWVTSKENIQHAWLTGLNRNFGDSHFKSKLNVEDAKSIMDLHHKGKTQGEISEIFGISRFPVYQIINKKHWSSKEVTV